MKNDEEAKVRNTTRFALVAVAGMLTTGCASIGSDWDYKDYETIYEDDDSCRAVYRDDDTLYFAGPHGFRIYAYNTDYDVFVKSEIEWRTKTIPYPIEPRRDLSQCDIQAVKDRMFRGAEIKHDPDVLQVIDEESIRVIRAAETRPEEAISKLLYLGGARNTNRLEEDLGSGYSLKYRGKALRENLPNAGGMVAVRSAEEQAEREAQREALKRERAEKRKQRLQAEREAKSRAKSRWESLSDNGLKRGQQICTWDDNRLGFVEDIAGDRIKVSYHFLMDHKQDGFFYYNTDDTKDFTGKQYRNPRETWVDRSEINDCSHISGM